MALAPPPTEAELTTSATTTIDSLPPEMLTEVLLRVATPAALVHAAAASRSWRGAVATPDFLARYRERHRSSTFLGLYVRRQLAGPPSFHMPDSIRLGGDDARDLKDAALRAFDYGEIRRYQDHRLRDAADNAFVLGRLGVHPDCRLLDCHNSRLLLTRGDEALEVRSPLARETVLLPFPPDVVRPYCLEACLLQGHDKAAAASSSFRVVYLQHRREGRNRQARAVEYDSRRKSWQDHPWQTIRSNIEGTPGEVMHAGHRIFCKYSGLTSAALVLDTRNMRFSVLPLPNYQSFAIGEMEDNVCCFVEAVGCTDHRLRVWQLDEEKLRWDLKKDIKMDQVLGEHVGYYRPRAVSNGIALLCSRRHHHFVVDLKTCSMKEEFEFHGQSAYPMQMPWPPAFSGPAPNAAGGFDRDGGPASAGDARTGVGLSDRNAACTQKHERNTKAIAALAAEYQNAAILQDLKSNAKAIAAAGPRGSATNGFDDGGLAKMSLADTDATRGARESDEIDDPRPVRSVGGGCVGTDPLPEAKKARLLHSSSIPCFVPSSSTAPPALMASTTTGSPSCPHQAAGGFDRDGGPLSVGDARTRSGELDLLGGTVTMAPPAASAVEPEEPLVWRNRSPFCVQSLNHDLLLQPVALSSCRQQGTKQAGKGSPEAMGPGRRNWKRKPKYLEAIFALRRCDSFSVASKNSDEVQNATSSCREASAASTAAVSAVECKVVSAKAQSSAEENMKNADAVTNSQSAVTKHIDVSVWRGKRARRTSCLISGPEWA